MNKQLNRIKDLVSKLDGTNPRKEYRILDQMQEETLLLQYQYELEKMDFSLDKENGGFLHVSRYVRKYIDDTFDDWIWADIDKNRLGQVWISKEDKNECLEVFMIMTARRKIKIGICAYKKRFEIAACYANMYGKKKMLEFHKASARGDVLSSVISKLSGFRKEEDNLFVLTLPPVSNMSGFKKNVFPKFKEAYLSVHQLSEKNAFVTLLALKMLNQNID